MTAIHKVIYS